MKPYKIYNEENIEQGALDQFFDALAQDFVVKGALMPDGHRGYSLPIGGVVATNGVIVPAYVGYDIGCGMCAYNTGIKRHEIEPYLDNIFNGIYDIVPVGINAHKNQPIIDLDFLKRIVETCDRVGENIDDAVRKCGTLGGGNHFIEIGYDENKDVWIIIHSGSRHFGHSIASYYMKLASGTNKAKEGHYGLDVDSEEGIMYIRDMTVALEYALLNRKMMMKDVMSVIMDKMGHHYMSMFSLIDDDNIINRNHNHAELKDGLWIHRKGATHAEDGMMGVIPIPGNMRDGSFIVRGKGNSDSLCSSSHGAGRVLGRRKAKEILNVSDFEDTMNGIVAKVGKSTLDESPFAYKDIFQVMNEQSDHQNEINALALVSGQTSNGDRTPFGNMYRILSPSIEYSAIVDSYKILGHCGIFECNYKLPTWHKML